jgi:hypothetical protein
MLSLDLSGNAVLANGEDEAYLGVPMLVMM